MYTHCLRLISFLEALGFQHFRVEEFCKQLEQTAYHTQMNYIAPIYFYGYSLAAGFTDNEISSQAKMHANKLVETLKELEEETSRREA